MSLAFVFAFVLAGTGRATATGVTLEIPEQGWSIAFDSPVLSQQQESKREGEYAFKANSGRIAKDTVQSSQTPRYVLQYDIIVEFQGQPIRQRHVNYFFAFQQKWVDVHISVIAPTTADDEIFAAFDRSLRYGA